MSSTGPPAGRSFGPMLLRAARRFVLLLVGTVLGTALLSLLLGVLMGSGVYRSLSVGFYIVGHASRFVPPGSVRVASTLSGTTGATSLFHVAYRTPPGRYVLITLNDGNAPQRFNISRRGKSATHTLGVGEVATYVW